MLAQKIVNKIPNWEWKRLRIFISKFRENFTLEEVVDDPGDRHYYVINLIQEEYFTVSIHDNDNIRPIEQYHKSLLRHSQFKER